MTRTLVCWDPQRSTCLHQSLTVLSCPVLSNKPMNGFARESAWRHHEAFRACTLQSSVLKPLMKTAPPKQQTYRKPALCSCREYGLEKIRSKEFQAWTPYCWHPTHILPDPASAGRRRRRRRGGVQRTASINNCLTRYSIQYRQLLKQREFHSHSLTSEVSSCFYLRAQRGRAFQTPHKALRLLMLLKRVSQRATERFMIQGLRSFNI